MSKNGDPSRSAPRPPAEERPRRVVSLLGQRPEPGEPPPPTASVDGARDDAVGERPSRGASGGQDALRSEHSTFRDLEPPRDDPDPERARAVCAQITRDALRDFAPALALFPAADRLRAQAVVAYARTLLDFARDRTLEGERLAQINRFEFALEAALGGEPAGQPVFVQLATLERAAPWPREAFDALASIARSRISVGLPRHERGAVEQRRRLARATVHAFLGAQPAPQVETLGAAVLRAASLVAWHDALWFHRPDLGLGQDEAPSQRFRDAVSAERRAILAELADPSGALAALPKRVQSAARYVTRAAAVLARRAEEQPDSPVPPKLSAGLRLALLVRALLGR